MIKHFQKRIGMTFWVSISLTFILIILALFIPNEFNQFTTNIRIILGYGFGWYYLTVTTLIVCLCVFIIFTPVGKIKLGDPTSKPEHSKLSWLAMLFSAGMGIGLVFYGAAEPLSHFAISAPEAKLYSEDALKDAFQYSFFHYGIHAWSIYAIVALSLAYFQFRKKEKTLISVTLKPILKEKTDGFIGKFLDSMTIFATVIGVSTTLGYGAIQISGGLNYLFGISDSFFVQLIIIVIATILYLFSALSGIGKGVKLLSNLNIVIAIIIMLTLMLVGPRVQILNTMVTSFGEYLQNFLHMSLRTAPGNPIEQLWIQQWTILYWSWWISWSPFVGVFIARISKGRTIKEFLIYVLCIPSIFSFLWFSIFGVASTEVYKINEKISLLPIEKILFVTLEHYPLGNVLSVISIILVFSFFITSADSATYVLAMQSEHGNLNPHKEVKIVWGILLSTIATILLKIGGLNTLQNVLIIIAFPFTLVLILLVISFIVELNYEKKQMGLYLKPQNYPTKDSPFRSYEE